MKKKFYLPMKGVFLVLLMIFGLTIQSNALARQSEDFQLTGSVLELETQLPLTGAVVLIKDLGFSAVADERGDFSFSLPKGEYELTISFIGFKKITTSVAVPQFEPLIFYLMEEQMALAEVEVLSTGYQEIPKERATGSFVQLDQTLIDRRVSSSILDRMEDVTSGVLFNRNTSTSEPLSIRGRGTLFGNTQPLIVVDNLPYEGNIETINPNDVATITVLKDAAAASIWGAQAGNGVIVITTKSGKYRQPVRVSVQSNLTLIEKPDLFYAPQMEISDFVAQEKRLFESGYYNSRINSSAKTPLSPVVEALLALKEKRITQAEADALLAQYGSQDIRKDLAQYYYRPAVKQQYAFQVNGGGDSYLYNFSGGYDHNLSSQVGSKDDRITLNAKQNWKLIKDKLVVSTGLYLSRAENFSDTAIPNPRPYEALADAQGNALPIVSGLNTRFVESTLGSDLLDWRSFPLNELGKRNTRNLSTDIRVNLGLKYSILKGLDAQLQYQYWTNTSAFRSIETEELYTIRNQINSFTQVLQDQSLSYAFPRGESFTNSNASSQSHNLRANLNYSLSKGPHQLTSLAGWELRDLSRLSDRMTYYGYDDATGLSSPVDYLTRFPQYQNPGLKLTIPYPADHSGMIDRYLSYFGNLGYTYKDKYLFTASARKDMSNLFGVATNQKAVPLWSMGAGWIISEESFYGLEWMPFLKMRLSYGYNGNVDKNTTAFTTIRYDNYHDYIPGLRYAYVSNPPNIDLRWEKIRITNLALDFESKSGRIAGSLEVYAKKGEDLIGETEVPDSNGIYQFRGNFSTTQTRGFDFTLNTINLNKELRWSSQFLLSGWKDEIVEFDGSRSVSQILGSNSANLVPVVGQPLFGVYSLPWGGLDPANGNPLGYLDGELSDNYTKIISSMTPETLTFHGSARPTVFGSIRNTVDWKGWSLSFNISYRLGYYFRRMSVDYTALSRGEISHADYNDRWQQSGDEAFTQIPSQPANLNTQRHNFYSRSAVLVEKGDHIRLQDVRLGYVWDNANLPRLPFRKIEAFVYMNNLGIIWKATDRDLDPDFRTMKPLQSAALGLRIDL